MAVTFDKLASKKVSGVSGAYHIHRKMANTRLSDSLTVYQITDPAKRPDRKAA